MRIIYTEHAKEKMALRKPAKDLREVTISLPSNL